VTNEFWGQKTTGTLMDNGQLLIRDVKLTIFLACADTGILISLPFINIETCNVFMVQKPEVESYANQ
jgi:hypothetical protein